MQQKPSQEELFAAVDELLAGEPELPAPDERGRLREAAETLLTHGMGHLLASDTHGTPPRRPPLLAAARARAVELIGPAADALVTATPAAIIGDAPLHLPPPRPVARHRRWWW